MNSVAEAEAWIGRAAVDSDGEKLGKVAQIWVDDESGQPEWASLKTGMFGSNETFVPLAGAQPSGDSLRIAHTKAKVSDAPRIDEDGHLEPADEQRLYSYYGGGEQMTATAPPAEAQGVARDTSGPTTDNAMTRSEEELEVGKVAQEAGRVKLRKHVVTEQQQVTVPVQREEVRVEREPITAENVDAAMDGPDLSEEEAEMVLTEEEVVVNKQVVPKERVRLDKDVITEEQTVSEDVRKERIDVDDDNVVDRPR